MPIEVKIDNSLKEISSAFNRVNALYSQWAQKLDINLNAMGIYYSLYIHGSMSQKQLSEIMYLPKQTVNHTVKAMDSNGHIILMTDENDKRSKTIVLTPEGKKYAEDLITPLLQVEAKVMRKLGKKRVQLFIEAINAYGDILQAEMDQPA